MTHISFVNLLFCGLLSTVVCYPAKTKHNDVNGQYYSELGKIIISDNTFTYVIFQGNEHVYATDTLQGHLHSSKTLIYSHMPMSD